EADPSYDGTNSEAFVVLHFGRGEAIIGGTGYAGEVKKSMFTVMNYYMPLRHVFPMHCSANMADDGHTAIFFGLSGTGKTTLSADPSRTLIGDDEHGWSDHGVFNFEGGCYAKVIRLSAEQARYYFLSGYTAKVAGTERGVTEPEATFSVCFGAPFLPLPPQTYSLMLGEKITKHDSRVWLVNTGWTGGPYGVGERMKL